LSCEEAHRSAPPFFVCAFGWLFTTAIVAAAGGITLFGIALAL
jgi:hypothetical protein